MHYLCGMEMVKENKLVSKTPENPSSLNRIISNITTGLVGAAGGSALGAPLGTQGSIIGAVIGSILLYYLAVITSKAK
jgi:uncharacterized membrane protein YeaQ/YmgE (transglycosylase-associated protein family)